MVRFLIPITIFNQVFNFEGVICVCYCFTAEVGKTCLIWRYASDQFSTKTMNTIGIDFKIKYVKIDDVKVKLQVSLLIFVCIYCMRQL